MAADPGSTRPSLSGACLGDDGVGLRWEMPAITYVVELKMRKVNDSWFFKKRRRCHFLPCVFCQLTAGILYDRFQTVREQTRQDKSECKRPVGV